MIETKQENGETYERVTLTHKGVYGICPIYIDDPFIDGGGMCIEVRHWIFMPLFWLTDFLFFNLYVPIHESKHGYPPPFCYKIQSEPMKKPIVTKWHKVRYE